MVPLPTQCEALYRGGKPWRITVVEQEPFVVVRNPLTQEPYRDTTRWSGFSIHLIRLLAERCHFRYTLQLPHQRGLTEAARQQSYGFLRNETASYGGGQRDVWGNHSDWYFAGYYATPGRMEQGLMTLPVMPMPLGVVASGMIAEPQFSAFLEPFTWQVWVAWIVATVGAGAVFWMLEAGKAGLDFATHVGLTLASFQRNFLHSVWLSWQATTGASTHTPVTKAGKLFSSMWSLFCIVMMASYTASLAAILVQQDVAKSVDGLEMLKSTGKRLCVQSNTAYANSLKKDAAIAPLLLFFHTMPQMEYAMMVEGRCAAMAHTGTAVMHAIHTACRKGYAGSMHLVASLSYLDQDMAVGLQFGYEAARDELSWNLASMRGSGEIDKLAKAYLIVASSPGCGSMAPVARGHMLEWKSLRGVYVSLFAVAGVCCLYRIVNRMATSARKGSSLHGFLAANFPPSTCAVDDVVNEWLRAWELRRILHPLVLRHLQSLDVARAAKWAELGARIKDIDNVTLASSGETIKRHRTEVLRRKMMLAFHSHQSAGPTLEGITARLEIKLRILAEVARFNVAKRHRADLRSARRESRANAPIRVAASAAVAAGNAAGKAAGAAATTVSGSMKAAGQRATPKMVRTASAKMSDGLQRATPQALRQASGKVLGASGKALGAVHNAASTTVQSIAHHTIDHFALNSDVAQDEAVASVFIEQGEALRETITEIRGNELHAKMSQSKSGVSMSVAKASFALKNEHGRPITKASAAAHCAAADFVRADGAYMRGPQLDAVLGNLDAGVTARAYPAPPGNDGVVEKGQLDAVLGNLDAGVNAEA
jgi:hypothetical protein